MYTVKELIEALKQCPEDYDVTTIANDNLFSIDEIGINHGLKTVALFSIEEE